MGLRERMFRANDRLNNVARRYFGPAEVGVDRRPTQVVPLAQQQIDCPACQQPLSKHELVATETERQRLYCPRPAR